MRKLEEASFTSVIIIIIIIIIEFNGYYSAK